MLLSFLRPYGCLALGLTIVFNSGCQKELMRVAKNQDPTVYTEKADSQVDASRAAWYNIKLGIAYLEQGQLARAKVKLLHAESLDPKLAAVHYALGMYFEQIGEMGDAEKAYKKAVKLAPNGGETHNNLGAFFCRQERYEEAQKEFKTAMKDPDYPNTADVLENAGLCAEAQGQLKEAKQYFLRAYRQDPSRQQATLELSVLALENKDIAESQKWLKLHEQLNKTSPRFLWIAAKLAEAKGKLDEAHSLRESLKQQFPSSLEAGQLQVQEQAK
jgi:type IV pilus assembly protein PilF